MGADTGSVLLIQFARAPLEGQVKTRMMPHLLASEACQLHCDLTLWTCRQLMDSGLGAVELSVAGTIQHPLFEECQAMGLTRLSQQSGSDLGQRMYNALAQGLAHYDNVILVGSDCPAIDAAYLAQAIAALQSAPVVVGPAADGGYVLIGARAISAAVFQGIPRCAPKRVSRWRNWGAIGRRYQRLRILTDRKISRCGMR